MTSQTTPTQEVVLWLAKSKSQSLTPLPGFAEIAQSLQGDNPLSVIARIPAEEADPSAHNGIVGSMLTVTWLIQCPTTGEVFLDMINFTLGIVDLGLGPATGDCLAIALEELSDGKDIALP